MEKLFTKYTFKLTKGNTKFNKKDFNLANLIINILDILIKYHLTDIGYRGRKYLIIVKLETRYDKYQVLLPISILDMNNLFKLKNIIIRELLKINLSEYKNIQFLYLPVPLHRNVHYSDNLETLYPRSMDFLNDWGSKIKDLTYHLDNLYFNIKPEYNQHWFINVVHVYRDYPLEMGGIFESTFIDYRQPKDSMDSFIRKTDSSIQHFIDGELISRIDISDLLRNKNTINN